MPITKDYARKEDAPALCRVSWVSWRSIFAGVITAIAFGIVLALLGVALGFTVIDPQDSEPMAGLGLTLGLWTLVSGVVSLAAGGFVAGMFAGERGCVHGFLVWSAVLILGALSTSIATAMALQGIGSLIGSAANTASAISEQAGQLADRRISAMGTEESPGRDAPRIMAVLRDTGVEQLQPRYIMGQMAESRRDMTGSLRRVTLDNYDSVIPEFLNRQKERLENVRNVRIDRYAAVEGLMRNRGIPREEAERQLDEALALYNYRLDQLETGLVVAQRDFEDSREYLMQVSEDARRQADEAASAAAGSALMAFIALVLGAIGSIIGGKFGVRYGVRCVTV